jgi:uncharacterized protein (TIGR04255 family)
MVNATKVAPGPRKNVSRREYRNPPVHEVIIDVQFHRSLDEKVLRELRGRLAESFPHAEQMNQMQMVLAMGPGGTGYQNMVSQFGGWSFKKDETWTLQTAPTALTLHLVRPGQWPVGPYPGWSAAFDKFLGLHTTLADVYGPLEPKRAGIRYLNRIAIPQADDLSQWLEFKVKAPSLLHDLYTFNLRQTWARAGEYDDISATVGLAKIDVGDPALAAEHQGVLLDIDVFNLWIEKTPSYTDLPDWFDRAHHVENEIFEGCITDALRERFDRQ